MWTSVTATESINWALGFSWAVKNKFGGEVNWKYHCLPQKRLAQCDICGRWRSPSTNTTNTTGCMLKNRSWVKKSVFPSLPSCSEEPLALIPTEATNWIQPSAVRNKGRISGGIGHLEPFGQQNEKGKLQAFCVLRSLGFLANTATQISNAASCKLKCPLNSSEKRKTWMQ